jgi:hypothetical protein
MKLIIRPVFVQHKPFIQEWNAANRGYRKSMLEYARMLYRLRVPFVVERGDNHDVISGKTWIETGATP